MLQSLFTFTVRPAEAPPYPMSAGLLQVLRLFAAVSSVVAASLCEHSCTAHGRCVDGACVCRSGFSGPTCATVEPVCPHSCSGHGICDGDGCVCDEGFGGYDCGRALGGVCPRACSGHGRCAPGGCVCNPGFVGAACEHVDVSNLVIGQEVLALGLAPAGDRRWFRATVTGTRERSPSIVVKFTASIDGNTLALLLPRPVVSYNEPCDVRLV